jgi:membrane protein DedA with SNARE-associated domain/uridine phosphorylase
MGLTETLCYYNTWFINQCSYVGIFLLMTLESMVAPIPSELVMPFAGFLIFTGQFEVVPVMVASSLGSIVGSLLSYGMGMLGKPVVLRYGRYLLLNPHHLEWTEQFFFRHGGKTIFISRFIPVVRHLISIPAGLAYVIPFILFTFAGATLWNGFLFPGNAAQKIGGSISIAIFWTILWCRPSSVVVVYLVGTEKGSEAGMSSGTGVAVRVDAPDPPGGRRSGALSSEAIINPTREPWDETVTDRVILTFTLPDYRYLCRLTQPADPPRYIYNCAVREGHWEDRPITLMAPAPGAPYAVMVLEKLIALGARMILALGWCGSLQSHLAIGDLVLPTTTVSTEGTSRHYPLDGPPDPDPGLVRILHDLLETTEARWQEGAVWSTDGFYRETADLVRYYQGHGVLGVDMEMAALFTLGRFRRVPVAGLLVVSDEFHPAGTRAAIRVVLQARDQAPLVLAAAFNGTGACLVALSGHRRRRWPGYLYLATGPERGKWRQAGHAGAHSGLGPADTAPHRYGTAHISDWPGHGRWRGDGGGAQPYGARPAGICHAAGGFHLLRPPGGAGGLGCDPHRDPACRGGCPEPGRRGCGGAAPGSGGL